MFRLLAPAILLLPLTLLAAPPDAVHEVATLDGVRVGHSSLETTALKDGTTRTTFTLDLVLKRFGSTVRVQQVLSTDETETGRVVALSLTQGVPGGKLFRIVGKRDGDRLLTSTDGRAGRSQPFGEEVSGLRSLETLFPFEKPKPGDKLVLRRYEPTYNTVLTVRATVRSAERVEVNGERRDLLRVDLVADPLPTSGRSIQPPPAVLWLDDEGRIVRRQVELDGLGKIVLTRTTREKAVAGAGVAGVDIGARSLVALNRAIPRPYDSKRVEYRFKVADLGDGDVPFVADGHQSVSDRKGESLTLSVHPARGGTRGDEPEPGREYLAPSHWLDVSDAIDRAAVTAVRTEEDPWRKAVAIERWVYGRMVNDNVAPLVPASEIAKRPRGDCRHHAFLCAAMARSAGLPARTAIGLLYVHRNNGPKLGFHTWAEVYVNGRWVGIDSTLGKGGVSAAHVKVTHHGWHKTDSLLPLEAVTRVVGRLTAEVVKAE